MARPRGKRSAVRFSVGLDEATYAEVSAIANQNDTTVAWIVRRAIGEFINRQADRAEPELPLLRRARRATIVHNMDSSDKVQ